MFLGQLPRLTFVTCLVLATASPAIAQTGTITGTVKLAGRPPIRDLEKRSSDPFCAKKPGKDERVVTGRGGGLRDAHVRVPVGAAHGRAPSTPAIIDQKDCRYTPRVVGIVAGQEVLLRNSDKTTHNIHAYLEDQTAFNVAQPEGAPEIKRADDAAPGEVLRLKCDVHAWMEAFIVVMDHTLFNVTDANGSFKITNVPPGKYRLEAWHPVYGLKTVEVTVKAGKVARANFTYRIGTP